jgi:tetratricopeptide (TPR) repeat protein
MSDMPEGTPEKPIDPTALDLKPELQWEILALMDRMGSSNPREVLGVPLTATVDDAKAAYFALARRFHPDQFFRKRLGGFQSKVEYVFTQLTRAFQEVLRNPDGPPPARAEPASSANLPAWSPDDLPDLFEAPDEVPAGPQIGGRPRERFAKAMQQQRFDLAGEALAAVEVEEPHALDIPKLRHELNRRQGEVSAQAEYQKGKVAHQNGEWAEAFQHFQRASSLDPRNATYVERAARSLVFEGDLKEAKRLAERAVELKPDDPNCRTTLAHVFQLAGMERNAKREYEAALKLDPKQEFARAQMRKLWWKG